MHPITDLIWFYNEQAPSEQRRQKIARVAKLLDDDPTLDAARVIEVQREDLGLVVPRTVGMIRKANHLLSQRGAVDLAPIVAHLRQAKLDETKKMEAVVKETKFLQRVLTPKWFGQLAEIVNAWDPEIVFDLTTHTAFMGYYSDAVCYEGKYLQTLDDAFDRLSAYGSVRQKLREIAGPLAGYVSTAFEMLVLRPLATADRIVEYEPRLPGGGRGEALVNLGGQSAYVEARAKMDEERGNGAFNPRTMGTKLFLKLQDKYADQYAGIAQPLVVFFSLGASVLQDIEIEALIVQVLHDRAAKSLTAVVFCDFYQPRKMWLWRNHGARHRLTAAAVSALYELFPIRRFQTTGLILGKKRRRGTK